MAEHKPNPTGSRKRLTLFEVAERRRNTLKKNKQSSVRLGESFQRWRALKTQKGLLTDALVAKFLLESYDKITSTPLPHSQRSRPQPPAVSTIVQVSLSDRDADFPVKGIETFGSNSSSSGEDEGAVHQDVATPSTSSEVQL